MHTVYKMGLNFYFTPLVYCRGFMNGLKKEAEQKVLHNEVGHRRLGSTLLCACAFTAGYAPLP